MQVGDLDTIFDAQQDFTRLRDRWIGKGIQNYGKLGPVFNRLSGVELISCMFLRLYL